MERIKEAISKARNSQGLKDQIKSRAQVDIHRDDFNNDEITYQETKIVQLDTKHLENNRIVTFDSEDPDSVAFDILRTQVLTKMKENNWRTLAITSPTPECGKTVVALNLAMSIAKQTEHTALIVDFDLRKPRISQYLGLPPGKSLFDFLENKAEIKDILVNPGLPRLVVLPNTTPVRNAAETLTSRRIKSMVTDLRDRYESRVIIFDLPPLMAADDAMAFLPQVDCVLLIVASDESTPAEVKESRRQLQSSNLIGVVLNKSHEKQSHYY
ncbi:CpsD/CapB family tyrosine-protein kinase [Sneathiella aquimaris]|uniref:CpsD/CapB family tyrosine-protein kinase n=1 Tax=Sneathiella aquimaris TaxID=2599305 RepID=UPI00146BBAD6|nr:CpsD/CapB family tyrosine-protein kinase [Sneathiella aquimaris]